MKRSSCVLNFRRRDDADFKLEVSRRPKCATHENHDTSPIPVEAIPPSLAQERPHGNAEADVRVVGVGVGGAGLMGLK